MRCSHALSKIYVSLYMMSQQTHQVVSRRAVSLTGLGALLLSLGGPAQALPGLPGATDKNEVYTTDTVRSFCLCL